jgi:hypothetical protein
VVLAHSNVQRSKECGDLVIKLVGMELVWYRVMVVMTYIACNSRVGSLDHLSHYNSHPSNY